MFRHWTRRARTGLVLAGVTGLLLGAGAAAWAVVAPAPSINAIGSGGYDSTTANPGGFVDGQEVVVPDQYSLTIAAGNQGAQGCNGATGESGKVGLHSTNLSTVFEAQWAAGVAPGCPVGPLTGTTFPNLANIPFNHHVWVHWELVKKVKRVIILVCILKEKNDNRPVPTPSPTQPLPTESATATPTATVTQPLPSPSTTSASPSASPAAATPTPTGTQTENPQYGQLPKGDKLGGDFIKCFIIKRTFTKTVAILQAQDLDAPVVTPVAGDLPGPQTVVVALPKGTIFDHASWGATENLTNMTACAGTAADGHFYPVNLAGPAIYTSGACQPANEQGYMTATPAGGSPTDPTLLDTTELIAPNAHAALIAPNNSLTPTTPAGFPHSTDPDASTAGGHAFLNLGSAPVG